MSERLIKFLGDNKAHLNYSAIEAEIGAPSGTISRVVRKAEYRHFSDEQETKIVKYLQTLGKNISKTVTEHFGAT